MDETQKREPLDVVVIGAGFAGLYMLHKLRALGMKAVVLEAAENVGGTWYWNRYPGARCDVESLEYSYSFDDALQQEWHWSERYATQPELLRYINHVADRFDLRRDIRFNTRVASAARDEQNNLWTLSSEGGETFTARYCISAVGCLSLPSLPAFKGRDSFAGRLYHTGLWPREGVDFTGLRVGVIGTGSSGVQVIPHIAQQAKHLHVFQRTPHYSVPAKNRPLDPGETARYKARYPEHREAARQSAIGIAGFPVPTQSALEVSAEERTEAYGMGWERGSTGYTRIYTDILKNEVANATASDFVKMRIQQVVRDPAVATRLTPRYMIGTKRLCLDTQYFETYNRENVVLVDVSEAPIDQITEHGIRTTAREYELDAIVMATGFDAITGALKGIDIRGSGGQSLAQKWEAGPRAYLGLMTSGFPNLFLITGPGSPSVLSNVVTSIEQHVEWIADCLAHLRQHGIARMDADLAAEDRWVQTVNEAANATLLPKGNSWYLGANVEGKPRVFMPYAGGVGNYRVVCDQVVIDGYRGFLLS